MHWELLGVGAVIIGVGMLRAPLRWAFLMLVVSTVFGAAAAFSLPSLGGASVLVPSLLLVFFAIRLFMAVGEGPVLAALAPLGPGFWLLLLTAYGLFSALFLPRFFEGVTETMTVLRTAAGHSSLVMMPLGPSSNNITQPVYAMGGLVCFACTFACFRRAGSASLLINALLAAAVVNLVFAVVDVATYDTGTAYLLDVVRTANYALLTDFEKGGFKRISGTFPEASAFAGYTIVLFAFVASLWLERVRTVVTGTLGALLLLALVFSTSATALAALAVVLVFLAGRTLRSAMRGNPESRPAFLAFLALAVPLGFLAVLISFPGVADAVSDFLDEMLFNKLGSQSGQERFMWNTVALRVFLDTWGIGAGLGSARASSYPLVLLSNIGIVGTAIFCVFIGSLLLQRSDLRLPALDRKTARAAGAGIVASLAVAFISGTVYDLGLIFYLMCGAKAALAALPAHGTATAAGRAERPADGQVPAPAAGAAR